MTATGIDYVYVETHDLTTSVTFWEALGFVKKMDLGDAALMSPSAGGPGIFLEAVPAGSPLAFQVYLKADDPTTTPAVDVAEPWGPSHWDTQLLHVRDPDGRVFVLQHGEGSEED
jgi:hypothetical protein